MNISSCEKFIYSEERRMVKDRVEKAKPSTKSWMIPTLEQILEAPVSSRIYHSACREHENDICLALHSSGTTGMFQYSLCVTVPCKLKLTPRNLGLPKVVNLTNGYLQSTRRLLSIQKPPGRKLALPAAFAGPTLNTAPFFHILGFYAIFESICHGMTFVNYPDGPITEEGVLSALSTSGARCATFPPSALEDLSSSNAFLNEIVKLDVIIYGGAALSSDVGRRLTQRTNVIPVIGSTETGPISSLAPTDRARWEYFEWNPEYGIDMQSIGDGLYEMVIPRPKARDFHPVFHIYPDISEYRTKDVFSPHPQHPSLWKAEARLDDVIVLSNGEKFNPINMERQIEMDPLVSRALVVGQGSFLPGVILELNWALLGDKDSDDQLIERLWQSVRDANQYAPDYAQLSQSVILVASQDRPFRTTLKGFTERQGTIKEYSADISRLLSKSEDTSLRQNVDWSSDEQVTFQINRMVSNLLSVRELSDEQNLFSLGMDSLQVVRLARMLQSAVQSMYDSEPKPNIGSQDIYAHPTIRQLSTYMQSLRSVSKVDPEGENGQRNQGRSMIIDELIEKYTQNILPPSIQRVRPSQIRTVLLTGSTGSLGNYLLHGLSRDLGVSKIICLTRDAGAEDRQVRSLKERGLVIRNEVDVQYLVAHESEPNLGLNPDTYRALSETVDIVIHNAWKVNFAEKLDSFEPNIQGVRRIIDFCLESKDNPHLHFISSIESVGDWSVHHSEQLPEDTVLDLRSVPERGYFESKFVAEQLCDVAASRSDLSVGIHRVGQLGGPTTKLGHWNTNEWLPSLIKTSKAIGLAPRDLGWLNVDWIPVVRYKLIPQKFKFTNHNCRTL
jgi:aryl carrier-like protein